VDTSSIRDRLQQRVYPGITNVTVVGRKATGISFETLVGLQPDVVILYSQKDGRALAERLEKVGIPSLVIVPETYGSIKESMKLIALAAGVEDRMEKIENLMDRMLSLIAERLSGLPEDQKKRAYFSSSLGLYSTTTANMLQNEMIVKAGMINVSRELTGYFQTISPEQLVKWNPDIMILSQHAPDSEVARLSEKVLSPLDAISQKRVYRCPSSLAPWDFPSPLSVLSSLWLAKKAYPDLFKDIDIKSRADEFHKVLFGQSMTRMNGTVNDRVEF
jgi:iron complex transport system substrate-binding protein